MPDTIRTRNRVCVLADREFEAAAFLVEVDRGGNAREFLVGAVGTAHERDRRIRGPSVAGASPRLGILALSRGGLQQSGGGGPAGTGPRPSGGRRAPDAHRWDHAAGGAAGTDVETATVGLVHGGRVLGDGWRDQVHAQSDSGPGQRRVRQAWPRKQFRRRSRPGSSR
ncbi:Transposase IS-4 (plasmid) [Deinococcus gobiensis I-0]|uniref:Transposase IS-4 n=1 Tax=Deinococcus gobiensis (strain DSM 21396 / JCM 16679 / CGMCC 1.7299 / I-0) TaxID=745776 RepID=H8H246_DEIGI|nr:Transposase IS-4 [Deinococcus gobiensis I-0]